MLYCIIYFILSNEWSAEPLLNFTFIDLNVFVDFAEIIAKQIWEVIVYFKDYVYFFEFTA